MRQLILLRHGQAEPGAASIRDIDRPLTEAGRREAARAGEALAAAGVVPGRALVSSARRTRETWEAASTPFAATATELRPELYDASAEALLEAARRWEDEIVAVVAHNPGVGGLAARLGDGAGAFPPGALAVFVWEAGSPRLRFRWEPA